MKKKGLIRISIIVIVVAVLATLFFSLYNSMRDSFTKATQAATLDLPSTYQLTTEDSSLIPKSNLKKVYVEQICRNEVRQPISILTIDSEYNLLMYKINISSNLPISNLLQISSKDQQPTPGYSYRTISFGPQELFFRGPVSMADSIEKASKVYVSLFATNIPKIFIQNDSLIVLYLKCRTFSLKYSQNGLVDIYGRINKEREDVIDAVPINVLFLKRGTSLYFCLASSDNKDSQIDPGFFYSFIIAKAIK